jgi:VanZ family protein
MGKWARAAAVWAPPLAMMALIFALSGMPNHDPDQGVLVLLLRKLAHFTEYALLLALWFRALRTRLDPGPALLTALAIAVAYAASDELHQTFVDGRFGTPRDVAIDAAGAAVAAGLIVRKQQRSMV